MADSLDTLRAFIESVTARLDRIEAAEVAHGLALHALIATHPDPAAFAGFFEATYEQKVDVADPMRARIDRTAGPLVALAKHCASLRD